MQVILIQEADSQAVVITIFTRGVCASVRPSSLFQFSQKQNQGRITTDWTWAVWIINDAHVLFYRICLLNLNFVYKCFDHTLLVHI